MTVKELIEALQAVENKDRIIVMSGDPEGNDFSPLYEFSYSAYIEDGCSGYLGLEKLTPELEKQGYSEEDVAEDGIPAVVL